MSFFQGGGRPTHEGYGQGDIVWILEILGLLGYMCFPQTAGICAAAANGSVVWRVTSAKLQKSVR